MPHTLLFSSHIHTHTHTHTHTHRHSLTCTQTLNAHTHSLTHTDTLIHTLTHTNRHFNTHTLNHTHRHINKRTHFILSSSLLHTHSSYGNTPVAPSFPCTYARFFLSSSLLLFTHAHMHGCLTTWYHLLPPFSPSSTLPCTASPS